MIDRYYFTVNNEDTLFFIEDRLNILNFKKFPFLTETISKINPIYIFINFTTGCVTKSVYNPIKSTLLMGNPGINYIKKDVLDLISGEVKPFLKNKHYETKRK